MPTRMDISAVIPAYNEAQRIAAVIQATKPFVNEVVVVDDGSLDGTGNVAAQAGALVVRQANAGYIVAIKRGFRHARGKVVVTLDADGEHHPEDIPRLVAPIQAGEADLVLGARVSEVPIELRHIDKPRRITWFHMPQVWYVLRWLVRSIRRNNC